MAASGLDFDAVSKAVFGTKVATPSDLRFEPNP